MLKQRKTIRKLMPVFTLVILGLIVTICGTLAYLRGFGISTNIFTINNTASAGNLAYMTDGSSFNAKLRSLAGAGSITGFAASAVAPDFGTVTYETVSEEAIIDGQETYPVYAWYDSVNERILYWSEADTFYANEDAGSMFQGFDELETIGMTLKTDLTEEADSMFEGCSVLTAVPGVGSWNTSAVTSMDAIFKDCAALTTLNIGGWNVSGLSSLDSVFEGCSGLTALNLSSWNVSNVTVFTDTFAGCETVSDLSFVEDWTMEDATTVSGMFRDCVSLTALDLSGWQTDDITDFSSLFEGCESLTGVSLKYWDTGSATDFGSMFKDCEAVTELDLLNWHTDGVTDFSAMFSGCSSLEMIKVGDYWTTENALASTAMFLGCSVLEGGEGFAYDGVTTDATYALVNTTETDGYLTLDRSETTFIAGSAFNTTIKALPGYSGVTAVHKTDVQPNFAHIDFQIVSLDTCDVDIYVWVQGTTLFIWSASDEIYLNDNASNMFNNLGSGVTEILGIQNFRADRTLNMAYMFANNTGITQLDINSWNPAVCTNTSNMFLSDSSLVTICNKYDWNSIASITSSVAMFHQCTSIVGNNGTVYDATKVDKTYARVDGTAILGYFTEKVDSHEKAVLDTNGVFHLFCDDYGYLAGDTARINGETVTIWKVWSVNLNQGASSYPNWYNDATLRANATSIVVDDSFAGTQPANMRYWFYNLSNVTEATGLNNIDVSNVTSLAYTFANCSGLSTLDISEWNLVSCTDSGRTFSNCSALQLIYNPYNWTSISSGGAMFENCSVLVGGNGTKFSTDGLGRARLDTPDTEGYFSYKVNCTANDAVFERGKLFNAKIKDLANGTTNATFSTANSTVTTFERSNTEPGAGITTVLVSAVDSPNPIYAWYDSGTVYWYSESEDVYLNPSCSYMFNNFTGLNDVSFMDDIDSSYVLYMPYMFASCTSLTDADLSGLDTGRVTHMNRMFDGDTALATIDLSGLDVSSVITMQNMFSYCTALTDVSSLTNWDTGSLTDPASMFAGCTALTVINLSGWDVSSVTTLNNIFSGCNAVEVIDLAGWNTASVISTASAFYGCTKLKTIYADRNWTMTNVTGSSTDMFGGCSVLVGGNGTAYNSSYRDKTYACIDEAGSPGYLTLKPNYPANMAIFANGQKVNVLLKQLSGSANPTYTTNNTTITSFAKSNTAPGSGVSAVLVSDYASPNPIYAWYDSGTIYWYSPAQNVYLGVDASHMFNNFRGLTGIPGLDGVDASYTTSLASMFYYCSALSSVDCLTSWDVSSVQDIQQMFYYCSSLSIVSLSGWDVSSVTAMNKLFEQCSSLTMVSLVGWAPVNTLNMRDMFLNCTALTTIYADSSWTTDSVTTSNSMFGGDTKLKGGNGTAYSNTYQDKTRACIDRAGTPGYFTEVSSVSATEKAILTTNNTFVLLSDNRSYGFGDRITVDGTNYLVAKIWAVNTAQTDYPNWYNDTSVQNCTAIVVDDSFSTVQPAKTAYWFYNMLKVTSLTGLENIDTSATTDMQYMFYRVGRSNGGTNISIDAGSWDVSNVTNLQYAFNGCSTLELVDISNWNPVRCTNIGYMFTNDSVLTTIICDHDWDTITGISSYTNIFRYCSVLVGGNGTQLLNSSAYYSSRTYARVDNPSHSGLFTSSNRIISAEAKAVVTTDDQFIFFCDNGTYGPGDEVTIGGNTVTVKRIYAVDTAQADKPDWYNPGINVSTEITGWSEKKAIIIDDSFATVQPENTSYWFAKLQYTTSFTGLDNLDTSETTNMSHMFDYVGNKNVSMTTLSGIDGWDTSKVEDMSFMFYMARYINEFHMPNWDVSGVLTMESMFEGTLQNASAAANSCVIEINNWAPTSCTNTTKMFKVAQYLPTIYCDNDWKDYASITSSTQMFYDKSASTSYNKTKACVNGRGGQSGLFTEPVSTSSSPSGTRKTKKATKETVAKEVPEVQTDTVDEPDTVKEQEVQTEEETEKETEPTSEKAVRPEPETGELPEEEPESQDPEEEDPGSEEPEAAEPETTDNTSITE